MSEYTFCCCILFAYVIITVIIFGIYCVISKIYIKHKLNRKIKLLNRIKRKMESNLKYAEFVAVASLY